MMQTPWQLALLVSQAVMMALPGTLSPRPGQIREKTPVCGVSGAGAGPVVPVVAGAVPEGRESISPDKGKTCRPVCVWQARALVLLCLWLLVLFREAGTQSVLMPAAVL